MRELGYDKYIVQALLGNTNSKARDIEEVGMALDALNNPLLHDFVQTSVLVDKCSICGQAQ